jgi:WD repeat-containing protein 23
MSQEIGTPTAHGSILDAALSTDNKWIAICNRSTLISMTTSDPHDLTDPQVLDLSRKATGGIYGTRHYEGYYMVFSVRFSGDGRELVAGTSDETIIVYDIERQGAVLRIEGHDDDVNAVCYGDPSSPHILYSGSDDGSLKVWDRRSLGDGRPAGVFLGHTGGLTYIDSKNDGRYVLSNSKDQSVKLWDLRKVMSTRKAMRLDPQSFLSPWDYRGDPKELRRKRHPHDSSVVTFRGHAVSRTLIRAHFSPPGSTDGQFIYSGSQDGKVYVWNLDSTLNTTLDVSSATAYLKRRPKDLVDSYWYGSDYQTLIRDASWHPSAPVIAGKCAPAIQLSADVCSNIVERLGRLSGHLHRPQLERRR